MSMPMFSILAIACYRCDSTHSWNPGVSSIEDHSLASGVVRIPWSATVLQTCVKKYHTLINKSNFGMDLGYHWSLVLSNKSYEECCQVDHSSKAKHLKTIKQHQNHWDFSNFYWHISRNLEIPFPIDNSFCKQLSSLSCQTIWGWPTFHHYSFNKMVHSDTFHRSSLYFGLIKYRDRGNVF
jgi:hypothetical protein